MTENYLTVTALTKYLKRKLEMDRHLSNVWLKGEISNFNHHSRGHMYFTLKDEGARIQSVMFAGSNRTLKFTPKDGMNVLVKGQVSIFERYGQYQLYIQQMEPDGLGSLFAAFEELKKKLDLAGYFSPVHKQQIPTYPKHIGIITSPTGAAIRDILTTLKRRYPFVKTTIFPVIVQGEQAAASIARAIEQANTYGDIDVLIAGRGGGSLEDLWAFNEEVVAKAIFHSDIPIISAVGHETDHTISDFVADLRAPTPTSAAELAVPNYVEVQQQITQYTRRFNRATRTIFQDKKQVLEQLQRSYLFRFSDQLTREKEQFVDQLHMRMDHASRRIVETKKNVFAHALQEFERVHPSVQLKEYALTLEQATKSLQFEVEKTMNKNEQTFMNLIDKLTLLNPLEVMKRGFAIPYNDQDEFITSIQHVQPNDDMYVNVQDGTLHCVVKHVKEKKHV